MSHIDEIMKANITVEVETLDKICIEFNLDSISLKELDLSLSDNEEMYICDVDGSIKTFPLPKKKEVSVEWIIEKINSMQKTEKAYKNLSKLFKKITSKYKNMSIYPTTYGIGVNTLYTETSKEFKEILNILDNSNIEYRLEWSDAMWVKRIILSKTKQNIINITEIV